MSYSFNDPPIEETNTRFKWIVFLRHARQEAGHIYQYQDKTAWGIRFFPPFNGTGPFTKTGLADEQAARDFFARVYAMWMEDAQAGRFGVSSVYIYKPFHSGYWLGSWHDGEYLNSDDPTQSPPIFLRVAPAQNSGRESLRQTIQRWLSPELQPVGQQHAAIHKVKG